MVTSDILSPLPATSASAAFASSNLTVQTSGMAPFSASGLDSAVFNYGHGYSVLVAYQ
jgi:hypothetical protein